jgi:hypothetical protein
VLILVADEDDALDPSLLGQLEQCVDRNRCQQGTLVHDPKLAGGLGGQRRSAQFGNGLSVHAGQDERLDAAGGGTEAAHGPAVLLGEFFHGADETGFGAAGDALDGGCPMA